MLCIATIVSLFCSSVVAILNFECLPFSLRKQHITFVEFMEWASNRTLSIGRSYAKEIHTPELTTLGASAKAWIRQRDGLYLHKVGKYELAADEILNVLGIDHVHYKKSTDVEIEQYVSEERKQWIEGVGECMVNAKLFTSEDTALVTFEEFRIFCEGYGLNPYEEAMNIDRDFYLKMQIADYILNNSDRHQQNWGFFMENETGKITGFCPLFDHDHAFSNYPAVLSQTISETMTLFEAAAAAQRELCLNLEGLSGMQRPDSLTEKQWEKLLERKDKLERI